MVSNRKSPSIYLQSTCYHKLTKKETSIRSLRTLSDCKHAKQAVNKADQYFTKGDQKYKKKTMAGWDLVVEWKDSTMSWLLLKMLKETDCQVHKG